MKVLLTGSEGFIGGYTKKRLLEAGHTVLAFSNQRYPAEQPPGVTLFYGDMRDDVAVTEAMAHSEAWIHLAGVLGTAETIHNPRPAAHTNVIGGLNVFAAAAQYKVPGVNIAVGNHWENNTYSITKSTMERFAAMFNKDNGTEITILRALNAFGPGQSVAAPYGDSKVRKIMPSFICRALSGDPIQIYGDGNQIMDMVYVDDVARSLVAALEYTVANGAAPHVLEAGSGRDTTVNEIAQAVVNEAGQGVIEHLPMRPGETPGSVVLGDPTTLEILRPYGLDYNDFVSLEEGLVGAVDYFRGYLNGR
jgi:UDP-glucose 4-epimerase